MDTPVQMIPEADMVVRHLVPVVLEAAGASSWAAELRASSPLLDEAGIGAAACLLKAVRSSPGGEAAWVAVVADCLFWAEAAVWSAAAGDSDAFGHHVRRVREVLSSAQALALPN